MGHVDCCDILLVIISFFIPPLGVFLAIGCHTHFWINLILSLFFLVPGILHAWWVILCKPYHHDRHVDVHYRKIETH